MIYLSKITMMVVCAISVARLVAGNENKAASHRDVLVTRWERAKAYTKEYLEAAPQDVYDFKPVPEMRTFGEQMLHLANGSYGLVNASTGVASPYKFQDLEKLPLKTRAEITDAVLKSYDFVIATIKGLDDTQLTSMVKIFGYEMTVAEGLDKAFEHQTHHRGQTTVYLRLKGIIPPHERLF